MNRRQIRIRKRLGRRGARLVLVVVALAVGASVFAMAANMTVTSDRLTTHLHTIAATPTTTTCTINPEADTFSSNSGPNATINFGTAEFLLVNPHSSHNSITYVRFPDPTSASCSSAIPSADAVRSVTLRFTASAAVTRTYQVRRVTQAWGETTLTYNNSPAHNTTTQSAQTTVNPASTILDLSGSQLTNDVKDFIKNPTANHGWRLADVGGTNDNTTTTFRSREYATVNERPQLIITYIP